MLCASTTGAPMRHHATSRQHFLQATHRLDEIYPLLRLKPGARHTLRRLPGHKILFSNGPRHYVHGLLKTLRLTQHFNAIYALEDLNGSNKPERRAFLQLMRQQRYNRHRRIIFVDDDNGNIRTARKLGWHALQLGQSQGIRHLHQLFRHKNVTNPK
jgi:putative hydrolase of the HAD superfamily